jgi:hypothetical protein
LSPLAAESTARPGPRAFNATFTVILRTPGEDIVRLQEYVPKASQVALQETYRTPGVTPEEGLMVTQPGPGTSIVADHATPEAGDVLAMLTGWGGQLPSVVELKTRLKGDAESVGAAVRVSVAGILTEVGTSPVEATVTVPV